MMEDFEEENVIKCVKSIIFKYTLGICDFLFLTLWVWNREYKNRPRYDIDLFSLYTLIIVN